MYSGGIWFGLDTPGSAMALGLRNDFVKQVVTDRWEAGSRGWAA